MNTTEIPVENNSYKYGWGIRPEGTEGGRWMYVRGVSFEGEPFEHWSFMPHKDVDQYRNDPDAFFKRWSGIKEVALVHPDLAWRYLKNALAFRL